MNHKLYTLENCDLFKNRNFNEIKILLSKIDYRIEEFIENEVVFSTIQNSNKIGLILTGAVDVQKIFPNGKVVIIERKKSPEVIGDSSIFSNYEYYPNDICACKSSKILFISKSDLLFLFSLDKQCLLNFLESTSNSSLMLNHKIGILSLNSIKEKIAGYLIHEIQYKSGSNNLNIVTLPFSKKAWAEYMNVSRTSLSRELRTLEIEGILSFQKKTIVINDINRLSKIISL